MHDLLENNRSNYLLINADCIPVKGAYRSAIYDLTREELTFFPSDYFYILKQIEGKNGEELLNCIKQLDDKDEVEAYIEMIHFLMDSEFAFMTAHPNRFPKLESNWEIPRIINDAIIDFDRKNHDINKILKELDKLDCRYLQIRFFSNLLTLSQIDAILKKCLNKSIQGVELILKDDVTINDEQYKLFIRQNPIISSLTIHSSSQNRELIIDFGVQEDIKKHIQKVIQFSKTPITSENHCGIITTSNLSIPSISSFFENLSFNGCLNRKISIDKNGDIKNCPSMPKSYGNIKYNSLEQILLNPVFKEAWGINKDQIDICRDCELRYICSDCRVYTEEKKIGKHPKPLKCSYNPYTAEWEE